MGVIVNKKPKLGNKAKKISYLNLNEINRKAYQNKSPYNNYLRF